MSQSAMEFKDDQFFLLSVDEKPTQDNFVIATEIGPFTEALKAAMQKIATMGIPDGKVLYGKVAYSFDDCDDSNIRAEWDVEAKKFGGAITEETMHNEELEFDFEFKNGLLISVREYDGISIFKLFVKPQEEESDNEPPAKKQKN